MRFQTRRRHVIDVIFPISLFFVFAISALVVLLLAADIYQSSNQKMSSSDESRTALSYISEKMRQNDGTASISIREVEDRQCLAITDDYSGSSCTTYIYTYDGMLKELFVRDDVEFSLAQGTDLMGLASLQMEQLGDSAFRFTAKNTDGQVSSVIAAERSNP